MEKKKLPNLSPNIKMKPKKSLLQGSDEDMEIVQDNQEEGKSEKIPSQNDQNDILK